MQATIPHIKTTAPKFSKADVDLIKKVAAEVEEITSRMDALHDRRQVKAVLAESANAYATGKTGLAEAILANSAGHAVTDEVIATLRGACKGRLRELYLTVSDDIKAADQHHVQELARIAAEQEESERADAKELGIGDDDFQPSPTLERLLETHRRAKENAELDSRRPANRADFRRLLDSLA
jgi:Fe-S cluster biogenesis protein NfuA